MNLSKYFDAEEGSGVLATSDKKGNVDIALYSRPHVAGRSSVSFIMKDRLSHRNLKTNPKAAYLFVAKGKTADGVRLYLTMTGAETSQDKILAMRRRTKPLKKGDKLFLVHFKVTKARALVGDREFRLS